MGKTVFEAREDVTGVQIIELGDGSIHTVTVCGGNDGDR